MPRQQSDPHQAVHAIAEIDRLNSDNNAHMGRDLNHRFAPQNARVNSATSGNAVPFKWILIREPRGCSSSMAHSCTELHAGNSMKVGFSCGSACSCTAMHSFFEGIIVQVQTTCHSMRAVMPGQLCRHSLEGIRHSSAADTAAAPLFNLVAEFFDIRGDFNNTNR